MTSPDSSLQIPQNLSVEQLIARNSPAPALAPEPSAAPIPALSDETQYYDVLGEEPDDDVPVAQPPTFAHARPAYAPTRLYEAPSGTRRQSAFDRVVEQRDCRESHSGGRRLLVVTLMMAVMGAGAMAIKGNSNSGSQALSPGHAQNIGPRPSPHHQAKARVTHKANAAPTDANVQRQVKEKPVKPLTAAQIHSVEHAAKQAVAASRKRGGVTTVKGVEHPVGGAPVAQPAPEKAPAAKNHTASPKPNPTTGTKKTAHAANKPAPAPQPHYTYPHIWEACQDNGEWMHYEQDTPGGPISSYLYQPQAGTCQQGAH